ncbi:hypothetical protein D3C71_1447200 [compost metagenome]
MEFARDALQLLQHAVMAVDDQRMQIECNIDKANGAVKDDKREVMPVRESDHFLGDGAKVSSELDTQASGIAFDQVFQKLKGGGEVGAHADSRGQNHFLAVNHALEVGGLQHMNPADRAVQAGGSPYNRGVGEQGSFQRFANGEY